MAKDPAFLFYPGDWQGGTITMTRHVKGCYIDLLMAQFNCGPLSLEEIKTVLGSDQALWTVLAKKFKKTAEGLFFNERLEAEKAKRKAYSESRSKNKNKEKSSHDASCDTHMIDHMENENENENKDEKKKGKRVQGKREKEEESEVLVQFKNIYQEFIKKKTGVPPKWDGTQVTAAKSIIYYLKGLESIPDEDQLLKAWEYILQKWDRLDDFQGRRLKLTEINSDLMKILDQIRNPKANGKPTTIDEAFKQQYPGIYNKRPV